MRKPAVALAILLSLSILAGCFGKSGDGDTPSAPTPTDDGGDGTSPPATSPTPPARGAPGQPPPAETVQLPAAALFEAVLVDAGRPGHEPVVAVAPDGTVFVHARGVRNGTGAPDSPGNNFLWRSRDGGQSFERVGSPEMERDTPSEGTVAVLPEGRVLVAYSMAGTNPDPTGGVIDRSVEVHASDDGGDTWALVSAIPLPSAHRTWLWPAGGDVVHLGAMSYNNVFHWVSSDAGRTWSGPDRVHDYNTYSGRMVGNDGTLVWPWFTGMYEQAPGDADAPWVLDAHTSSDGRAWVPNEVATVEGRASVFAGAAVDEAGTFYLTWATWSTTGSVVWFASSPDGASWSTHAVAEGPGLRVIPWIASPGEGRVGVVWYQNDGYSGDPLQATGPWYAQYATVDGADGPQPNVTVVRPVVEAILDGPLCLQAFSCGDVVRGEGICFTPLPDPLGDCTDLDHVRNYDDYVGLEYLPDGTAVMAFVTTQGHGLPDWTPGEPGHVLVIRG